MRPTVANQKTEGCFARHGLDGGTRPRGTRPRLYATVAFTHSHAQCSLTVVTPSPVADPSPRTLI